jgi:hypothetical protein
MFAANSRPHHFPSKTKSLVPKSATNSDQLLSMAQSLELKEDAKVFKAASQLAKEEKRAEQVCVENA